jgi:hypothetical protein
MRSSARLSGNLDLCPATLLLPGGDSASSMASMPINCRGEVDRSPFSPSYNEPAKTPIVDGRNAARRLGTSAGYVAR